MTGAQLEELAKQVTPAGDALVALLDSLHVDTLWAKDKHIAWFSGEPNAPGASIGVATHCSAFAAAVAERLGVPLLRPPNHGQVLLASPQQVWLKSNGPQLGWRVASGPVEAQAAANLGMLAVISKQSIDPSKPGHIAVVRPNATPDIAFLVANGPQEAQAGSINSGNITADKGFKPLNTPNVIYAVYDRQAAVANLSTTSWTTKSGNTRYLLDLAPAGRVDTYKLGFTSKGSPMWTLSAGGVALANQSSWAAWYTYALSSTTLGEPYTSRRNGYVAVTPSGGKPSIVDNGAALTVVPDPVATPSADGITGLWYASVDNVLYGVFLTHSDASKVGGYVLGYGSDGSPEWQQYEATWDGTPGSKAVGVTNRCTSKSSCTQTAGAVTLTLQGPAAQVAGLAGVDGAVALEKATVLAPFLGPVA